MGLEYGWKKLLEDSFNISLDNELGIDLDGRDGIKSNEWVDGILGEVDYYVDEEEAKEFCRVNGLALANFIPFLDSTIRHHFSADNPIIELMLFESQIFADYYGNADEIVEEVYSELEAIQIGIELKELEPARMLSSNIPATIEDITVWAHDTMADRGIVFEDGGSTLFMENFAATMRRFDCDISTYAFIAAAHELGWEIRGVTFPDHLFGRYILDEETGEHVNIEVRLPAAPDDDFYMNYREHGQRRVNREANEEYQTYLHTLSDDELRGTFFFIFGTALLDMEETEYPQHLIAAREAFDEAITLNPGHAASYVNRCSANVAIGDLDRAIADCSVANDYDPNDAVVYANFAHIYIKMAQQNVDAGQPMEDQEELYEQALDYLTNAIDLDPDRAALYTSRSLARLNLGLIRNSWRLIRQARSDAARALELDPESEIARDRLSEIELSLQQGI